jgi:hypothetical protein
MSYSPSGTHKCGIHGCDINVPDNQLLCRPHWFSIPKQLRDQVWYTSKTFGAATPEHRAACTRAREHARKQASATPNLKS